MQPAWLFFVVIVGFFNLFLACLSQFSGKDPNQHKRVSAQSNPGFLERLSETAGGTVVGVGLFFLSIYVLFTNEVRNRHMYHVFHAKAEMHTIKAKVKLLCYVVCWYNRRLTHSMLAVTVSVLRDGLCEQHCPWMRVFLRLCHWGLSPASTCRTTTV